MPGEGRADSTASSDVISILVATDNHLGYLEKDPIRGNDSFVTFDEILKIAVDRNVDMVLLGGDLFHDNRPSHNAMVRCMESLRTYCWGSRPCALELLSDPAETFVTKFSDVNYMDPNINVNIPVFSIHGNHDDPSGEGNYAALDTLAVAGLVNYFGKQDNADDITVKPVLLRKGRTHLAIYGLGNIRDERLHRTFLTRKVKMLRPSEDTQAWFNIMVIHQNRIMHGPKNWIPEYFLESFLHLVVWGHEHDCRIDPERNHDRNFDVTQPGSSVATALSEGEALPKHVALLKVRGGSYKLEKIRLHSVRPFVMDSIVLSEIDGLRPSLQSAVNECLAKKVDEMIERATDEWLALNVLDTNLDVAREVVPPKPLIRLKVDYSGGFVLPNPQRFGQLYVETVANPRDLLMFHRKRATTHRKNRQDDAEELATLAATLPDQLQALHVSDLVDEYLERQSLQLLPENELGAAVKDYIDKDVKEAIKSFVEKSVERTRNEIIQMPVEEAIEDEDSRVHQTVLESKEKRKAEFERSLQAETDTGRSRALRRRDESDRSEMDDDQGSESLGENEEDTPGQRVAFSAPKRGASSRSRPSKSRKGKTPGSNSGTRKTAERRRTTTPSDEELEDLIEEDEEAERDEQLPAALSNRKRRAAAPPAAASSPPPKRAASDTSSRATKWKEKAPATRQAQLNFAPASSSSSSSRAPAASVSTLAPRSRVAQADEDNIFEELENSPRGAPGANGTATASTLVNRRTTVPKSGTVGRQKTVTRKR